MNCHTCKALYTQIALIFVYNSSYLSSCYTSSNPIFVIYTILFIIIYLQLVYYKLNPVSDIA